MATASFDKSFVVRDPSTVSKLLSQLQSDPKIRVVERDVVADSKRGLAQLKLKLSRS